MNNIAFLRKQRKLTRQELSTKANISREHLSQLESGKFMPNGNTLTKLATALECTVNDLLDEKEKPPDESGKGRFQNTSN